MPSHRLQRHKKSSAHQSETLGQNNQPGRSQQYLSLWMAIRKTRGDLEQWQQQAHQVETLFNQHIAPREKQLTETVSSLTHRLIVHFSLGQLDNADRSLVGLWVTENLTALKDHPFADKQTTQTLGGQWMDSLDQCGPVESHLRALAHRQKLYFNTDVNTETSNCTQSSDSDEDDSDDELLFDFGWHKSTHTTKSGHRAQSSGTKKQTNSRNPHKNQQHDNASFAKDKNQYDSGTENDTVGTQSSAEHVQKLNDKLSVSRLFRSLAQALHPDREQDDQKRAIKHELMRQCIQARKDKDVDTLLSLYCEHIGTLPEVIADQEQQALINALETQLRSLQQTLRHQRWADPFKNMIIERYTTGNNQHCSDNIQSHADSLDHEIKLKRSMLKQLAEHQGLIDALDERRAIEQDRLSINEMTGY